MQVDRGCYKLCIGILVFVQKYICGDILETSSMERDIGDGNILAKYEVLEMVYLLLILNKKNTCKFCM